MKTPNRHVALVQVRTWLWCLLTYLLATHTNLRAQDGGIYVTSFTVTSREATNRTGVLVNRNDVLLVRATGKATYGPFAGAILGEVGPEGSPHPGYRATWNRTEFTRERFGALIARIDGKPFYYAMQPDFRDCITDNFGLISCPATPNPVAGALIKVESAGELLFEINDQMCFDNDGVFEVELVVMTSKPVAQRQNLASRLVCNLLTTNQRTNLLNTELLAIQREYQTWDNDSVVKAAGVRWHKVAIEVTGMLVTFNQIKEEMSRPTLAFNQIGLGANGIKLAFLLAYAHTTKGGQSFLEGVASYALRQDVYTRFYGPLSSKRIQVKSPFWFDVAAVYAEQYNPNLQSYYQGFNNLDRLIVEGPLAQFYSKRPGCLIPSPEPFRGTANIGNPLDRVRIGLYKMGYSWQQINLAVDAITTHAAKGYEPTITALKEKALY
jgi:hypothetical protein